MPCSLPDPGCGIVTPVRRFSFAIGGPPANAELLQLQSVLGLSAEQQEQVFSVVYDQTLRQLQG
jgi:hypothetical protein